MIIPVKNLEIVLDGGAVVSDVRKITIEGGTLTDDGNGEITYTPPAGSGGTTDHASLTNLAYATSGHTGFAGIDIHNIFSQLQEVQATLAGVLWRLGIGSQERSIRFGDDVNYAEISALTYKSGVPTLVLRTVNQNETNTELFLQNGVINASIGVFQGDGSGLTGVIADLPSNVALIDSINTFIAGQIFTDNITIDSGVATGTVISNDGVKTIIDSKIGVIEFMSADQISGMHIRFTNRGGGGPAIDAIGPTRLVIDAVLGAVNSASGWRVDAGGTLAPTDLGFAFGVNGVNSIKFNNNLVNITGKIGTDQTVAGTTLGTVIKKLPLYDSSGVLIGHTPVYDTIT
jgi:hypothetical protein